jgi:tetratricopeptide (TPR) repeat protein
MLILAHDRTQEAARTADPAERAAKLTDATAWAERAATAHPDATNWRALVAHKARAAKLANDPAEGERLSRRAAALPRTAADGALEARELLLDNRPRAALDVLAEATRDEPGHFWCAFYAAAAHQLLERHPEAERGFDACILLRPGFAHAHYNRGLSRFYAGRAAEAEADFDRALTANPGWAHALYGRALAREARGTPESLKAALLDLSAARAAGHTPVPLLLVRARVHAKLGDTAAAEEARAKALADEPTDDRGWAARGTALLPTDQKKALAAYEQALALNPRSAGALQGKVLLLGESGKAREALDAVNALLEVAPDSADAWCGRAVLKARAGDRAGARADADEALKLAVRADTLYALAGAYGRFAATDPEARRTALRLLDDALRAGVGFEHLNADPDLDELRKVPEFEQVVTAARAYRERVRRPAD